MKRNAEQHENERIVVFKRLCERKDLILVASRDIEDLRHQYRLKGNSDPEGELEKEVFKRLYTIISCLSELTSYATGSSLVKNEIFNFVFQLRQRTPGLGQENKSGYLHPLEYRQAMTAWCALANSIQIKWDDKRGFQVHIGEFNLSLLKA